MGSNSFRLRVGVSAHKPPEVVAGTAVESYSMLLAGGGAGHGGRDCACFHSRRAAAFGSCPANGGGGDRGGPCSRKTTRSVARSWEEFRR
ncbi:hypothetical protein PUNSTDRAFT_56142 [Punctularia strigosozonata HHB-11173 SS5]|uniref:Uncharacterized protein n=1 Tax=Punctularia strigosozonata (strain HHB-11173) TaxID=741275 RepID=R7S129_PUNST|nr:uncharacterized protein PUNSTDRAFT_56142 [Punctularia strigosozonata HHB-11173 SS5]EIN03554.1 hypothetical protein PUNSTDRAFT_56142 [Punctularia strigosozonata HHB-11173 SS5]